MCEDPCNDSVTGPIVTDTTINVNNIASMINVGGEVEVYKNATVNPFELRTLKKGTEGNTVGDYGLQLVQQATTIDFAYNPLTTNTVWVDQEFGLDNTGQVKHEKLKFQTIGAAVAAATTGYTIVIAPGTYTETEPLSKTGITLAGSPSVIIYSTNGFVNDVGNFNIVGGLSIFDTPSDNFYIKGGFFELTYLVVQPSTNINVRIIGEELQIGTGQGFLIADTLAVSTVYGGLLDVYCCNLNIVASTVIYQNIDLYSKDTGLRPSIYNIGEMFFHCVLPLVGNCNNLTGYVGNIYGQGTFKDAIVNCVTIECRQITIETTTNISAKTLNINNEDTGPSAFLTFIDTGDNIHNTTLTFDILNLRSTSTGYAPYFITDNNLIRGSLTIRGDTVKTFQDTPSTKMVTNSQINLEDATIIINVKNWKNDAANINEFHCFSFMFNDTINTSSVIINGSYQIFTAALGILNLKKFKLSGDFEVQNSLAVSLTPLTFLETFLSESLSTESTLYLEDLNIISNEVLNDYTTFSLKSTDPLRKYSFKNVKMVNIGAGADNICIGTSPATTVDISISGMVTSNADLATGHLLFGTINNVTSPDLDLITNSNII